MIELLVFWCFGRAMYDTAKSKGRSGWLWVFLLIFGWSAGEVTGAVLVAAVWPLIFHEPPGLLILYLVSLLSASIGGVIVGKVLDGQSSKVPPPLPIRFPTRRPKQPSAVKPAVPIVPAPAPSKFKFSCPHCGQHISATAEYVGTDANCPTCEAGFVVPAPQT